MLKVGLTGNIGSGKSTVARIWASLGAELVDADRLARLVVEPGTPSLRAVVERWGPGVLDAGGALDRSALREIVFADPAERAALEAILHPAIAELRDQEYRRLKRAGAATVIADIPLLFEAGLEDEFDVVVLVDAPEAVRRERIVRDRGLAPEQADRMITAQMPAAEKRQRADLVIENDGSKEDLESRARAAWAFIQTRPEADGNG
ncbi:MAG: dephospho-CoA kinase [Gemmatimonadetes bacterium]|nr:dephospho-CoA kinase [Gemmatimonadota bacterium]